MSGLRNRHFALIDLLMLPAAAVLAFALRLDAAGMAQYRLAIPLFIAIAVPVTLLVGRWLGLYRRLWRYASLDELLLIAAVSGVSTVAAAALLFGLAVPLTGINCPRSIPIIYGLLVLLFLGGPRFLFRLAWQSQQRLLHRGPQQPPRRVLIMGAGNAGSQIVREILASPSLGLVAVGFLDDDPRKHGVQIFGVPVLGGRDDIPKVARERRAAEVIIAIPSAPGSTIRQILDACEEAGIHARTVPGLYDILSGRLRLSQIREVDIEDLLRREPVRIDATAVEDLLRGKRVLVTGGGGSIGGELCRQIARAGPECLVVLGHGENSIFHISRELMSWARCDLVFTVADIRDRSSLERLFSRYRPELVFHAAAHKHVPLMETNLCEAVSNNILGTRNLAHVASNAGTSHFILISTDKAVNPTSIMGVTKRVAELLVYQLSQQDGTCFAAVRFGNVLGSRGSVVDTFKRQIAQGGPVTVTHPEMRRFFMTIPEAVQLVLQAAALGQGGEVFVLDMGEPVRIADLATDLVRLSGFRPKVTAPDGTPEPDDGDWDIEVVFTGARPGEKLYEELFADGEECRPTRHEKIMVAENGQDRLARRHLDERLARLAELVQTGDAARTKLLLQEIVPEYNPQSQEGSDTASSAPEAEVGRVRWAA